jgi:hypothetical protein
MSLFKRGLVCKAITLDSLFVNIVRINDSTYNFSDLLTPSKKTDTTSSPFRFSLNNINISNGRILFNDKPENAIHEVKQISLGVPFISNFNYYTNVFSTPSFSAIVNETPVSFKGKTRPFDKSMETSFDCNINKIDLAKYVQYIPNDLQAKLTSAYLSTDGHFTFMVKNKKPFFDYSGNVSLDSIAILSQNDSLIFRLPGLSIDIASAELVSSKINLKAITISEPYLNVIRNRDGTISLLNLLPPQKSPARQPVQPSPTDSSGFSLTIDTIYLHKGKIQFLDLAPGKPVIHSITPVTSTISSFKLNNRFDFSLFLANNITQTVALNGTFQFSPLSIKGNAKLDSIVPAFYAPYFPRAIDIAIKKGILSLASDFDYMQKDNSLSVNTDNGRFILSNLLLHRKSNGEKLIQAREVKLLNAAFNLLDNSLTLDSVISDNVKIFVKRQSDSTINFANLVLPDSTDSRPEEGIEQTGDASASIFRYTINTVKFKNNFVQFNDFTTSDNDSLQLDKINLTLSGLSNIPKQKASLGFNATLNSQGRIAASGTVQMTPLQSALQLDISTISLKPVQTYLANQLNIVLTDGLLNLHGKIDYALGNDNTPQISYRGNLQIDDFVTINKENADNFLLWKSLAFKNISYVSNPATISVDTINVDELYSLFNIYADGTTNLQKILKTDTTVKTQTVASQVDTTKKGEADPVISINTVSLDNCNINFSDFSFRNVFSANMKNLTGTVSGLSSLQDKTADVMINGNYDATSPITIRGTINPLAKNLFMDLGLNFKDIDITQMNPYAQKYLGYVIRKGKLTLDLRYFVENNRLNSSNKIFLDQLTLGESVESSNATKLPVKFALSLLRDQNGDIKLDVPVTGSIDDPKFNVGKILLQVLGNIITKAVTSPFAALGALFGNTDELSFLEYNPGSTVTNAQAQEKLDKLTKILQQKEDLSVEIQGFADPVIDHDALKKQLFERKMKTLKLKDLLRASNKNILVDTITIKTDEYENYLSKAYSKEQFEKPKTKLGFTKALPVPEMEKLINDNIRITNTELKTLAATRALSIKESLVNSSHIDASRLFLIESTSITSTKKDVTSNNRVEFTLKAK